MRIKIHEKNSVSFSPISIKADSNVIIRGIEIVPNSPIDDFIAIILHGYRSNSRRVSYIANSFLECGSPTILMDLRGHGKSDGDCTNIKQMQEDIKLYIDYIKSRNNYVRYIALVGVSLGGLISLTAGLDKPEITHIFALATIASPSEFVENLTPIRKCMWKLRAKIGGLDLFSIKDDPQFIPSTYLKNPHNKKIYLIHCQNDHLAHVRNFWKNVSVFDLKENFYHLFKTGGHNFLFQKKKIKSLILNWIRDDL